LERRLQRVDEQQYMDVEFALINQIFLLFVYKLDRVLDGNDMTFEGRVQIIGHARQGGGFVGAGRTGGEDRSFFFVAPLVNDWQYAEFSLDDDLHQNVLKHGAESPLLHEHVDAKSGNVAKFERRVALLFFFKVFPLYVTHQIADEGVSFIRRQGLASKFLEVPVDIDHRQLTCAAMAIRGTFFNRERQEFGNIHRDRSIIMTLNESDGSRNFWHHATGKWESKKIAGRRWGNSLTPDR